MPRRKNQRKRHAEWTMNSDEGETVDDLAHAAMFAMMLAPQTPEIATSPAKNNPTLAHTTKIEVGNPSDHFATKAAGEDLGTADDIDIESTEEDDSVTDTADTEGNENTEVDDDDESDVDLAEAVARMEQGADDGDDEEGARSGLHPPRTEHELDAYQTPIGDLEKHLQFQLSVTEIPDSSSGMGADKRRQVKQSIKNLPIAGHVKHYMAMDRTVVIESIASNPHGTMEDWNACGNENAPLDEGSLLVLLLPPSTSTPECSNQVDTSKASSSMGWIPLGRIFEVFGPVSQPLYTVRLPLAKSTRPAEKGATRPPNPSVCLPTLDSVNQMSLDGNSEAKTEESNGKERQQIAKTSETAENDITSNSQPSLPTNTSKDLPLEESASKTDETPQKEKIPSVPSPHRTTPKDPWAPQGEYGKLLQGCISMPVYYVREESKLIDTGKIAKSSGKGCDASNVFDEEVVNTNEMYYSDDEEERLAKNRRRNKDRGINNSKKEGRKPDQDSPSLPGGFHQASSCMLSKSVSKASPLPEGFHHAPPSQQHQGSFRQRHTSQNPGFQSVRPPYQHPTQRSISNHPPPPPASGSSAAPPAYQY